MPRHPLPCFPSGGQSLFSRPLTNAVTPVRLIIITHQNYPVDINGLECKYNPWKHPHKDFCSVSGGFFPLSWPERWPCSAGGPFKTNPPILEWLAALNEVLELPKEVIPCQTGHFLLSLALTSRRLQIQSCATTEGDETRSVVSGGVLPLGRGHPREFSDSKLAVMKWSGRRGPNQKAGLTKQVESDLMLEWWVQLIKTNKQKKNQKLTVTVNNTPSEGCSYWCFLMYELKVDYCILIQMQHCHNGRSGKVTYVSMYLMLKYN